MARRNQHAATSRARWNALHILGKHYVTNRAHTARQWLRTQVRSPARGTGPRSEARARWTRERRRPQYTAASQSLQPRATPRARGHYRPPGPPPTPGSRRLRSPSRRERPDPSMPSATSVRPGTWYGKLSTERLRVPRGTRTSRTAASGRSRAAHTYCRDGRRRVVAKDAVPAANAHGEDKRFERLAERLFADVPPLGPRDHEQHVPEDRLRGLQVPPASQRGPAERRRVPGERAEYSPLVAPQQQHVRRGRDRRPERAVLRGKRRRMSHNSSESLARPSGAGRGSSYISRASSERGVRRCRTAPE
jgi:hypothetical protein